MRQYHIREIMSKPVISIEWSASVLDAEALMETNQIRRLPVVDDENVVVGIISLGDVREATSVYSTVSPYAPEHDEIMLSVDEVMTSPAMTVGPDDRLVDVVKLMVEHKIGGLPVVDAEGHPVGMITEYDVFRLLIQSWESGVESTDAEV